MEFKRHCKYYIDEYKTLNEFIKELINYLKNMKIKSFISTSGLSYKKREYSDKIYDTDESIYIIFESDIVLKFDYNYFSMINLEVTTINSLKDSEIQCLKNGSNFDFDCYGETIVDYELNKFDDEYIINPSSDIVRPKGGDYFKEIIFHLSNGKKICICAENAEADGYCNVWMENNNIKGIFNGESHKTWWN